MEENKNCGFDGLVTISTQEYRDLVYRMACNEKEVEFYKDKYWDAKAEISKLNAEISSLRGEEKC